MQVRYTTDVYPPGAIRPDEFEVSYIVTDPDTGVTVYRVTTSFMNEAGQPFDRIYRTEMQDKIQEALSG